MKEHPHTNVVRFTSMFTTSAGSGVMIRKSQVPLFRLGVNDFSVSPYQLGSSRRKPESGLPRKILSTKAC